MKRIDTSRFVSKTKYNTDKSDLERKTHDTSDKNYNAKISAMESITSISSIISISGLATNSALTAFENKMPDISNLVKKNQIMIQKYQILNLNILLQLIITNLLKILLVIA